MGDSCRGIFRLNCGGNGRLAGEAAVRALKDPTQFRVVKTGREDGAALSNGDSIS